VSGNDYPPMGGTYNEGVRMVVLRCPSCGGELQARVGQDRVTCDHCGSTVLIVDAGAGKTRIITPVPISPEVAETMRRTTKMVLWIVILAFLLPIIAAVLVNVILALVSLVLGHPMSGGTR
jgi:uncharacterized protein (DUF983 family)